MNVTIRDSDVEQSSVFKSTVPGGSSELTNQLNAYRKLIEQEQAEINLLKQQIQKKGSTMSKPGQTTARSGSQANLNWEENGPSSGAKFKFIHLIFVSIVFLLLGSYLAKLPLSTGPETSKDKPN